MKGLEDNIYIVQLFFNKKTFLTLYSTVGITHNYTPLVHPVVGDGGVNTDGDGFTHRMACWKIF